MRICVYPCASVHVYVFACLHVFSIGTCVFVHVCAFVCVSVCACICVYLCVYVYVYAYVCAYVHVRVGPRVRHTDAHCHVSIYLYLQTYTTHHHLLSPTYTHHIQSEQQSDARTVYTYTHARLCVVYCMYVART